MRQYRQLGLRKARLQQYMLQRRWPVGFPKGKLNSCLMKNSKNVSTWRKKPALMLHEQTEGPCKNQLCETGQKALTGGWFVSEEADLLAHHDGSCSYYDITNYEFKAEYKPPLGVSNNLWGDCLIIRDTGYRWIFGEICCSSFS